MTGYVFAIAPCIRCGVPFSFNPNTVPSTTALTGQREPLCESCFTELNRQRVKDHGLEPWPLHPNAYEPIPEEDF